MLQSLRICIKGDPGANAGGKDKDWRQEIARSVISFLLENKSLCAELFELPSSTQFRVQITFVLEQSYLMKVDLDNMVKSVNDTLFFNPHVKSNPTGALFRLNDNKVCELKANKRTPKEGEEMGAIVYIEWGTSFC